MTNSVWAKYYFEKYVIHTRIKTHMSSKLLNTLGIASSKYPLKYKRKKFFRPTSFHQWFICLQLIFFLCVARQLKKQECLKTKTTQMWWCVQIIYLFFVFSSKKSLFNSLKKGKVNKIFKKTSENFTPCYIWKYWILAKPFIIQVYIIAKFQSLPDFVLTTKKCSSTHVEKREFKWLMYFNMNKIIHSKQ